MEGLIWLLFWGGLFYAMMHWGCGAHMVHGHSGGAGHGHHSGPPGYEQHHHAMSGTDPVCGMDVDATSEYERSFDGHQFRFCSVSCRDQFEADPEHYPQS